MLEKYQKKRKQESSLKMAKQNLKKKGNCAAVAAASAAVAVAAACVVSRRRCLAAAAAFAVCCAAALCVCFCVCVFVWQPPKSRKLNSFQLQTSLRFFTREKQSNSRKMPEADFPLVKKKEEKHKQSNNKMALPVRHFVSAFRQNDDDPREMIAKPRQTPFL